MSHILIIGAAGGIGAAITTRLAAYATITATARNSQRLAALAGPNIRSVSFDVTNLDGIAPMLSDAVNASGPLDALVYCAGVQLIRPLRSCKPGQIQQLMTVNLVAPLVVAGAFASKRISSEHAVFCAVSSIAAQRPDAGIVPYASSKAGLDALVKGLATEAAPRRAVAVAPGWVDTEMTRAYPAVYSETFKENLAKQSPLGITNVSAVADAVEFLVSDRAAFITGEIIRVDGGSAL